MQTNRKLWVNRGKETIGLMLIGDGVVALLEPERHVRLWAEGPKFWRMLMNPFVSRPALTRFAAVLEVGLGLWISSRQDVPSPVKAKWTFWKSNKRT
jgi:hypothetical protein